MSRAAGQSNTAMFRTVRLVIVSLATIGAAFGVYTLTTDPQVTPVVEADGPDIDLHEDFLRTPMEAVPDDGGIRIGPVPIEKGGHTKLTIMDEDLSNKFDLGFEDREPLDEHGRRWRLVRPNMTFYMPDGEKATIRADEGIITVRTAGRLEPVSGKLFGHAPGQVQIIVDRTNEEYWAARPEEAGMPTPQDQKMRIWLDEVEFDRERASLSSSGAVQIESREMRLTGTGLKVRWSEATNRVEYLEVTEGETLSFKSGFGVGLDMNATAFPGGSEETLETGPTENEALVEPVADVPPLPVEPETPIGDDVLIIDLAPSVPEAPSIQSYEIEFARDVVAWQKGAQGARMTADRLVVIADLGSQGSAPDETSAEEVAPSARADGDADPGNETDNSAARPVDVEDPKAVVVVTWNGPLILKPAENPEDGQPPRRLVTASGSPVVVQSNDGFASAAQLQRDAVSGQTRLLGSPSHPVILRGGQSMNLHATDLVELNMDERHIDLRGDVTVGLEDSELRAAHIEATFGDPAKKRRGRALEDLIDQFDCREDVVMVQAGGRISCQHLVVNMEPDAEGRNLPHTAFAVDDVIMIQSGRQVQGDEIDLLFGDLPVDAEGIPTARWPALKSIDARRHVVIVDPRRNWDIRGNLLQCEFDELQAMKAAFIEGRDGEHAQVQLGDYFVSGASVLFDDRRPWAHVPGAGVGRFTVAQDLDGRNLGAPVPIEVTWSRQMTLNGEDDRLRFEGDAVAVSDNNELHGDVIEIRLTDVDQPVVVAEAPPADPMHMWFLRPYAGEVAALEKAAGGGDSGDAALRPTFGKRATQIVAWGPDTRLESRSTDPLRGTLTSQVTLRSPRIAFDLDAQVMVVDQAGVLGIEDYPGAAQMMGQARPESGLFGATTAAGPSQTVVRWDSSMRYHYAQRAAEFTSKDGPTLLKHFSGSYVRITEQVARATGLTPDLRRQLQASESGRTAQIVCRRLIAQFAEQTGGGGEMSLGGLKQFEATGRVILEDSKEGWYVSGDRVVYVAEGQQLIEVHGEEDSLAFISRVSPDSGRGLEARCSSLFLELISGQIDAPDCPTLRIGE